MNGQEIKETLSEGRRIYSTLISVTDPKWLGPLKNLNLDFAFIDTEHIPLNLKDVASLCHFFNEAGTAPVVRISDPDPNKACVALDAGASGILAPYIETVEEVLDLAGAVKYKPLKGQKLRQFLDGEIKLEEKLLTYLEEKNQNNLLFINIESLPAVENLENLLAVKELDGIIIGPHDLSCSLGIPEEYDHPLFLSTIDKIIKLAVKSGKGIGYHKGYSGGGSSQMILWAKMGMNILIHEADILAAAEDLNKNLMEMRSQLGDAYTSRKDELVL